MVRNMGPAVVEAPVSSTSRADNRKNLDEGTALIEDAQAWQTGETSQPRSGSEQISESNLQRSCSCIADDGRCDKGGRGIRQSASAGSSTGDLPDLVRDLSDNSDSSEKEDLLTDDGSSQASTTSDEDLPAEASQLPAPESKTVQRKGLALNGLPSLAACRHDASKVDHEPAVEVVKPSDWTPRQMHIATQSPLRCRDMTRAEFLWWIRARVDSLLGLIVSHTIQYLVVFLVIVPWILWGGRYLAHVYCVYGAFYSFIFLTNAQHDGSRQSERFRKWFGCVLEKASVMHFNGGMTFIRESKELSPEKKYIFTYHPHGLFPAIMTWFSVTSAWSRLFPGINPVGLVATAIFRVPFLRDFGLWGGLRDVSRRTFLRALGEKGAVVMCPGGQSELALHQPASTKRVVLAGRKTGFLLVALETECALVPMAVFGESQLMENVFYFPAAQRFTYKLLGFPVPFLPLGLWGFLPIPRKGRVSIVMGEPFHPRDFCAGPEPTSAELEAVRAAYFEHVLSIYKRHQDRLGFDGWTFEIDHKR